MSIDAVRHPLRNLPPPTTSPGSRAPAKQPLATDSPHKRLLFFVQNPDALLLPSGGDVDRDAISTCIATFAELMVSHSHLYASRWDPVQFPLSIAAKLAALNVNTGCSDFIERVMQYLPGGRPKRNTALAAPAAAAMCMQLYALRTCVEEAATRASAESGIDGLVEAAASAVRFAYPNCCADWALLLPNDDVDDDGAADGARSSQEWKAAITPENRASADVKLAAEVAKVLSCVLRVIAGDPMERFGLLAALVFPLLEHFAALAARIRPSASAIASPQAVLSNPSMANNFTVVVAALAAAGWSIVERSVAQRSRALRDAVGTGLPQLLLDACAHANSDLMGAFPLTVAQVEALTATCSEFHSSVDDASEGPGWRLLLGAAELATKLSEELGVALTSNAFANIGAIFDCAAAAAIARGMWDTADRIAQGAQCVGLASCSAADEASWLALRCFCARRSGSPGVWRAVGCGDDCANAGARCDTASINRRDRVRRHNPCLLPFLECVCEFSNFPKVDTFSTSDWSTRMATVERLLATFTAQMDVVASTAAPGALRTLETVSCQLLFSELMASLHAHESGSLLTGITASIAALHPAVHHFVHRSGSKNSMAALQRAPLMQVAPTSAAPHTSQVMSVHAVAAHAALYAIIGGASAAKETALVPLVALLRSGPLAGRSFAALCLAPVYLFSTLFANVDPPRIAKGTADAFAAAKHFRRAVDALSQPHSHGGSLAEIVVVGAAQASKRTARLQQRANGSVHNFVATRDSSGALPGAFFNDFIVHLFAAHTSAAPCASASTAAELHQWLFRHQQHVAAMLTATTFELHRVPFPHCRQHQEQHQQLQLQRSPPHVFEWMDPSHCFVTLTPTADGRFLEIVRRERQGEPVSVAHRAPLWLDGHNLLSTALDRINSVIAAADRHGKTVASDAAARFSSMGPKKRHWTAEARDEWREIRQQWWNARRDFDVMVREVIDVLQWSLFGPWVALVVGGPSDVALRAELWGIAAALVSDLDGITASTTAAETSVSALMHTLAAWPHLSPHYAEVGRCRPAIAYELLSPALRGGGPGAAAAEATPQRQTSASSFSAAYDRGETEVFDAIVTVVAALYPDTIGRCVDLGGAAGTEHPGGDLPSSPRTESPQGRMSDGSRMFKAVGEAVAVAQRAAVSAFVAAWERAHPEVDGGAAAALATDKLDLFDLPRQHVFLVLERTLHALPWEGMPALIAASVSRVPSESFVRAALDGAASRPAVVDRGVRRSRVFFVLNPTGTTKESEERFAPIFAEERWHGLTGTCGAPGEVYTALTSGDSDLYLYIGHDAGERIIPPRMLTGTFGPQRIGAAALLMGCHSARVSVGRGRDAESVPLAYLHAGSPAVVGCLWDVTDGEVDRLTRDLLLEFLCGDDDDGQEDVGDADGAVRRLSGNLAHMQLDGSSGLLRTASSSSGSLRGGGPQCRPSSLRTLPAAVAKSRRGCKFRFLTGAAVVVYGLPVAAAATI